MGNSPRKPGAPEADSRDADSSGSDLLRKRSQEIPAIKKADEAGHEEEEAKQGCCIGCSRETEPTEYTDAVDT